MTLQLDQLTDCDQHKIKKAAHHQLAVVWPARKHRVGIGLASLAQQNPVVAL